jgi:hypothetical protein
MSVLFPDDSPVAQTPRIPAEPTPPLHEQLPPPPRSVVLGLHGKLAAAALLFIFWLFLWSCRPLLYRSGRTNPVDILFFAIMLLVILVFGLRSALRALWERKLLCYGDRSTGKVISQQRIGNWARKSLIIYEFPVGGHKPMIGRGTDWTRNYKPNKPVVVFYDPQDISRYVAFCSTGWRVRTHTGAILEP